MNKLPTSSPTGWLNKVSGITLSNQPIRTTRAQHQPHRPRLPRQRRIEPPPPKFSDLLAFHGIAPMSPSSLIRATCLLQRPIKDLEVSWDSAEAGLQPRAADDWHVLDKAIDKVLEAFRADMPSQADYKATMTNLLKNLRHTPRQVVNREQVP